MTRKFDPALIIAIPLLGILGGGYLSLPITSISRGKEPWTSIVLLLCLVAPIWLVGRFAIMSSPTTILWSWAAGLAFYLIMASAGGFRQHIEPFFVAHMMAFLCMFGLTAIKNKNEQNKALVPTAGAAMSAMFPVTLTRLPVSTLIPAPAVGTA